MDAFWGCFPPYFHGKSEIGNCALFNGRNCIIMKCLKVSWWCQENNWLRNGFCCNLDNSVIKFNANVFHMIPFYLTLQASELINFLVGPKLLIHRINEVDLCWDLEWVTKEFLMQWVFFGTTHWTKLLFHIYQTQLSLSCTIVSEARQSPISCVKQ